MTIQQCRYVLQIARSGSFSEAAKQLFVAQSSLSFAVKTLEGELGITVFKRTGNGVSLTDEGAEFVKYAQQICRNMEMIQERYDRNIAQKLYISTQHYDFIADIFGKFLGDYTKDSYRFSIREIETHKVIEDVQTACSDIGILAIKNSNLDIMKRYLSRRKLSFTPLLAVKPHVFVRKDHPLAQKKQLCLVELKEYPYVSYEQGENNSDYFVEELMNVSYIDKHIEITDRATLMNVLLLTDAYTVGTGIMPSALNKGDIISIPMESDGYYQIGYILNEERKTSAITEKFIKRLKAQLEVTK